MLLLRPFSSSGRKRGTRRSGVRRAETSRGLSGPRSTPSSGGRALSVLPPHHVVVILQRHRQRALRPQRGVELAEGAQDLGPVVELVVAHGHRVVTQQVHALEVGLGVLQVALGHAGVDVAAVEQRPELLRTKPALLVVAGDDDADLQSVARK